MVSRARGDGRRGWSSLAAPILEALGEVWGAARAQASQEDLPGNPWIFKERAGKSLRESPSPSKPDTFAPFPGFLAMLLLIRTSRMVSVPRLKRTLPGLSGR